MGEEEVLLCDCHLDGAMVRSLFLTCLFVD